MPTQTYSANLAFVASPVRQLAPAAAEPFLTLNAGAGTGANKGFFIWRLSRGNTSPLWYRLSKPIVVFDTNIHFGNNQVVTAAILRLGVWQKFVQSGEGVNKYFLNIYSASPADPTNIVASDYLRLGTTPLSTAFFFDDIQESSLGQGTNSYVLSPSLINLNGYTSFSIRTNFDTTPIAPTWFAVAGDVIYADLYGAVTTLDVTVRYTTPLYASTKKGSVLITKQMFKTVN